MSNQIKIPALVEEVFSHAVALEQSGRLRNTVYVQGRNILILNQDHTVLLRFTVPESLSFSHTFSFKANDYDSNQLEVEGDKIVFVQEEAGFERKKKCSSPEATPAEVRALFQGFTLKEYNEVHIPKEMLSLLDPDLSHIEIAAKDGQLSLVQRNIYTGTTSELTRKVHKRQLLEGTGDDIKGDFGPIGIRTSDFTALFSFCSLVTFHFPVDEDTHYTVISGKIRGTEMKGILAHCLYDELGRVESAKG